MIHLGSNAIALSFVRLLDLIHLRLHAFHGRDEAAVVIEYITNVDDGDAVLRDIGRFGVICQSGGSKHTKRQGGRDGQIQCLHVSTPCCNGSSLTGLKNAMGSTSMLPGEAKRRVLCLERPTR